MRRGRWMSGVLAAALGVLAGSPAVAGDREADVLRELNLARTAPQVYAGRLREYRKWFSGRVVAIPGAPDRVLTREGVGAVDEAIRFLDRQRPLPALRPDATLALAAHDWVAAQGARGGRGHFSPDGRGPGERVAARGGGVYVAENIAYGPGEADMVVLQLIVDDGVPDRGHRRTIFDPAYGYAGAACGGHAVYGHMCVIEYSASSKGAAALRTARTDF